VTLFTALGGVGFADVNPELGVRYISQWGGQRNDMTGASGNMLMAYWSQSKCEYEGDILGICTRNIYGDFNFYGMPNVNLVKNSGMTLRCVRDTTPPVGCNDDTPGWGSSLGTVSFATNNTWPVSNQVWSDAVTATACNKISFDGGASMATYNLKADCRSNPGYPGDYFSWCAIIRFENQLCPPPWRIPTGQEFVDLDIALGGNGQQRFEDFVSLAKYRNDWGGAFGGMYSVQNRQILGQGNSATYWSRTETPGNFGVRIFGLGSDGSIRIGFNFSMKGDGVPLRCVRDG
jgi:uncharacterized protein (TIGR02145 family)